ncbi:MAG: DUF1444 family protein [Planctomycetes bacterium]|nr:DUF1444 family protein [Planctomycetota bacterium]
MNTTWKDALAYLKPEVPESDTALVMKLSEEDSPVLRNLGNGLLVSYVVDTGERFSYVQTRHLRAAGVTEDELHRAAIDNLYGLAEKHLRVQPYGDVFALFMEGSFEASVMLLDTVWDVSLAKYVRGEFLVAVPTRDVLAFGDASSPGVPERLRGVVDRVLTGEADHPVSNVLFRRRRGVWEPSDA